MAAMGYLPVELAGDAKILPPVNHECQTINFPINFLLMYASSVNLVSRERMGKKWLSDLAEFRSREAAL